MANNIYEKFGIISRKYILLNLVFDIYLWNSIEVIWYKCAAIILRVACLFGIANINEIMVRSANYCFICTTSSTISLYGWIVDVGGIALRFNHNDKGRGFTVICACIFGFTGTVIIDSVTHNGVKYSGAGGDLEGIIVGAVCIVDRNNLIGEMSISPTKGSFRCCSR